MTVRDELLSSLMGQIRHEHNDTLAEDVILFWQKVVRKFSPLIGGDSTLLVFERSVQQSLDAFPWLPPVAVPAAPETMLARLRQSMDGRAPTEVIAAQGAVLSSFIDQMQTLIGIRLTAQFFRAAFPAGGADRNTQENPG